METVSHRIQRASLATATPAWLISLLLAAPAASQSPVETGTALRGTGLGGSDAAPLPAASWHVPPQIATDDAGNPTGALWAGGDSYKIRFGAPGETRFVPRLGTDFDRNLPLGLRTASVRIGGHELFDADAPAERSSSDRQVRWSWNEGALLEVHDLLEIGSEQSFVLRRPSVAIGDLDIALRLDTELQAQQRGPQHAAIDFYAPDDVASRLSLHGRPVVRYGAAVAIDAAGRRLALESSLEDGHIHLHAPAWWLESAQWPVTVDPLTSRVLFPLGGTANRETDYPQIARDEDNSLLGIAYGRAFSNGDWDTYVRVRDDNFGDVGLVYVDLEDSRSTRYHSICWNNQSNAWVVAAGAFTQSISYVRLLKIGTSETTTGGETLRIVPRPANTQHLYPVLGGSGSSTQWRVLLAYEEEQGAGQPSTSATRLRYRVVDVRDLTLDTPVNPRAYGAANYDAQAVSISHSDDTRGWGIVWQERVSASGEEWTTEMARVDRFGAWLGHAEVAYWMNNSRHRQTPKIAGHGDDFLVAYTTRDNVIAVASAFGDQIELVSLRWPTSSSTIGSSRRTVLETSGNARLTLGLRARPVARDRNTDSHWGVTWRNLEDDRLYVARVGYDGKAAESRYFATDTSEREHRAPSITFDQDNSRFAMVWSMNDANFGYPLAATHLTMSPDAVSSAYGFGCAGDLAVSNNGADRPYAGSQHFKIHLVGGLPGAPVWLLASNGPSNLVLPGAPGCRLLLSTQIPLVLATTGFADQAGHLSMDMPLPSPAAGVDVHWQVVQLTPQGLSSSTGLLTQIR